jgi:hypothetical protein
MAFTYDWVTTMAANEDIDLGAGSEPFPSFMKLWLCQWSC